MPSASQRLSSLVALLLAATAVQAAEPQPSADRRKELIRFVRQECGFCHGLRLTGGLGTPLTQEALKDKDFDGLVGTILTGRPGTAMPGWQPFLTEVEAQWIVRNLQKGFPE
ncbi:MAG: cytochrome c [Hydrogenophilaceae bacterium]|nr:cytochrome c [Hydrogenophilaceae bacterium]